MSKYILAIDQGTTSTRAFIFNQDGKIINKAQKEFTQYYPKPGWVEHDPEEIWNSTIGVINKVIKKAKIAFGQIDSIGITNQRETTILWDKNTGEPLYNAIVWQCRRTSDICKNLKNNGLESKFNQKTGLVLDPYFSGTKIKWVLDNVEGARKQVKLNKILFGTIDTYLIWKLTGGKVHITDYTNASRTLLYNIHDLNWDQELLKILDIPENILPKVRSSSEIYGYTDKNIFMGENIPIAGIAGDQQAATFAQNCFEQGMTKITFGTGAFLLMNTGNKPVYSKNGLLTTIAWGCKDEIIYALEGSIFNAGSAIQWLRDELHLIDGAADSEYFAKKVESSDGVCFIPAFTGLGAPYWNPEARGTIVGLTRGSSKNHIIRATLESLVYQSKDLIEAMLEDSGLNLKDIKVDGGASANDFLMQFLADMTNTLVERPINTETTVTGAAYLAGLATNFWPTFDHIREKRQIENIFQPDISNRIRDTKYKGWKKAVKTVLYSTKL
ncbi:MAG: glycerol kinase GlpK [Halanaerobiales bacterium]|nr:glycerol kinase GlpK [Halanaerobiales bacterium]